MIFVRWYRWSVEQYRRELEVSRSKESVTVLVKQLQTLALGLFDGSPQRWTEPDLVGKDARLQSLDTQQISLPEGTAVASEWKTGIALDR